MKTQIKQLITFTFFTIIIFTSCVKKDFDPPNIPNPCEINPKLTANVSIFDIQKMFNNGQLDTVNETVFTFPKDSNFILKANIISSDESGNLYKEIYIEDSTGAMKISIDGTNLYNDFNQGQEVFIKLTGLNIEHDDNAAIFVLGMGLYDNTGIGRIPVTLLKDYIFKKSCPKELNTTTVQIGHIYDIVVGKLVKLENVQFRNQDLGTTYADPINQLSLNKYLKNCTGDSLIVRTSGYANFAGDSLPTGNGNIIGIMTKYGNDYQLTIVNPSDVKLDSIRCN